MITNIFLLQGLLKTGTMTLNSLLEGHLAQTGHTPFNIDKTLMIPKTPRLTKLYRVFLLSARILLKIGA